MPDEPTDFVSFVRSLGVSASDMRLLMQLADEATVRFASDAEATVWFELQVRKRYPRLWRLLQTNSAPHTSPQ